MVDLQTLPKVLPAMVEIEFLSSSRMLQTSLGKPCRLRKQESVIKDGKNIKLMATFYAMPTIPLFIPVYDR